MATAQPPHGDRAAGAFPVEAGRKKANGFHCSSLLAVVLHRATHVHRGDRLGRALTEPLEQSDSALGARSSHGRHVRMSPSSTAGAGARTSASVRRVAAVVVFAFAPAIACSHQPAAHGQGGSRVEGGADTFMVKASPQRSDGRTVVIDEAIFRGAQGYVAIHNNGGGAPGPTIGVSDLLPDGVSTHVRVVLRRPLATSGTVFAMLHIEDDHNSSFDFPAGDQAANLGGRVVVVPLEVTVAK